MRRFVVIDVVPLFLAAFYVLLCPFNKVEESFHLQATHDILVHGWDLPSYDHQQFPGVVPRTFLGALYLSACSLPWYWLVRLFGLPKIFLQIGVRLSLAALVCTSFVRLVSAVGRRLGRRAAVGALLAAAATPHFLFYSSRTLPNVFALYLVQHGIAHWLQIEDAPPANTPAVKSRKFVPYHLTVSIIYFVLAVLWFRCDMLVLLGPVALSWLVTRKATILQLIVIGGIVGVAALGITVIVDSYFWGRWLWPEGVVLFYNTVENKSAQWGVEPWHWYGTNAIPRAFVAIAPFILLGCLRVIPEALYPQPAAIQTSSSGGSGTAAGRPRSAAMAQLSRLWNGIKRIRPDWRVLELLLPVFGFIGLYSLLPHKELRFLLPAFPLLYVSAGRGMMNAYRFGLMLLWGQEIPAPGSALASLDSAGLLSSDADDGIGGGAFTFKHSDVSKHKYTGSAGTSSPLAATGAGGLHVKKGSDMSLNVLRDIGAASGASMGHASESTLRHRQQLRDSDDEDEDGGGRSAVRPAGPSHSASSRKLASTGYTGSSSSTAAPSQQPTLRRPAGLSVETAAGVDSPGSTPQQPVAGLNSGAGAQAASTPVSARPGLSDDASTGGSGRNINGKGTNGARHLRQESGRRRRFSSGLLGDLEDFPPRAQPGPILVRMAGILVLAGLVGALAASSLATVLFVRVSMENYPGGSALQRLYARYALDLQRSARVGKQGVDLLLWSLEQAAEASLDLSSSTPSASADAASAAIKYLPPCPEYDVTSTGAFEWWRQCMGKGCPHIPPWMPSFTVLPNRPCAPIGDPRLRPIKVHIDGAAAESGVSRFGEAWSVVHDNGEGKVFSGGLGGHGTTVAGSNGGRDGGAAAAARIPKVHPPGTGWIISKAEDLTDPADYEQFDILITGNFSFHAARFDTVDIAPGRPRVTWRPLREAGRLKTEPTIYIMKRKPDQLVFKPVVKGKDKDGGSGKEKNEGNSKRTLADGGVRS